MHHKSAHDVNDPTKEGKPKAEREFPARISNFTKALEKSLSCKSIILEEEEPFESLYHSEKFVDLEKSNKNKSSMLSIQGLKNKNSEEEDFEEPARSQLSER